MTTIFSPSHLVQVDITPTRDGYVNIRIGHDRNAGVRTSQLLGALDAVPRARAEDAEAAVERVRELIDKVVSKGEPAGLRLATGERFGLVSTVDLSNALNPKPVFTLPTEAGARFTAQGNDDAPGSRTNFVTLAGADRPVYMAVNDVRCVYEAAGVMEHYADHRHEEN